MQDHINALKKGIQLAIDTQPLEDRPDAQLQVLAAIVELLLEDGCPGEMLLEIITDTIEAHEPDEQYDLGMELLRYRQNGGKIN